MPTLAWRSDVDGFAFSNSWSLDSTERAGLAALASGVIPAAVGAVGLIIPDPITLAVLTGTLTAAAQGYLALGPSPPSGCAAGWPTPASTTGGPRHLFPAAPTPATSRPVQAGQRLRCAT
jgi:hypothetical protein